MASDTYSFDAALATYPSTLCANPDQHKGEQPRTLLRQCLPGQSRVGIKIYDSYDNRERSTAGVEPDEVFFCHNG